MKKWVLYIIGIVCGTAMFSCTAEEEFTDTVANDNKETIVSLALNVSYSRNASETDKVTLWENYIDEVRIFAFVNDTYKEEVTILSYNENDKTMLGKMKSEYEGNNIELVVLTNMKSRGVSEPSLNVDKTNKRELYKQLVFNYEQPWNSFLNENAYIPMWGITKKIVVKEDTETYRIYDGGIIDMYRAVAKIDILINNGDGIADFAIKKIELCNVLNKGYCASLETPQDSEVQFTKASLPGSAIRTEENIEVFSSETGEQYKIENRIYIPEIGQYNPLPYFHLKITASFKGKERFYDLYMRTMQTDPRFGFDIIRNYHYIFNINTITADDEIKIGYAVDSWGMGTNIELPFD